MSKETKKNPVKKDNEIASFKIADLKQAFESGFIYRHEGVIDFEKFLENLFESKK
jgi:hypothetical protein